MEHDRSLMNDSHDHDEEEDEEDNDHEDDDHGKGGSKNETGLLKPNDLGSKNPNAKLQKEML